MLAGLKQDKPRLGKCGDYSESGEQKTYAKKLKNQPKELAGVIYK
jgi:hypothetical protein